MPPKRQYSTIKNRSNKGIYVLIIFVFLGVIVIGGTATIFGLNQQIEAVDDDSLVSAVVTISGNDVRITIVDEGKASSLIGASISISGITKTNEATYAVFKSVKEDMVFPNVAYGVTGERYVLVKGYFDDYSSDIILSTNVYFG